MSGWHGRTEVTVHLYWLLPTWLRRKGRWSTTKEVGIETKAVVIALVSRRGRGQRKREILRSIKEKWRPAKGRTRRMYRRKRRNGHTKGRRTSSAFWGHLGGAFAGT